MIWSGAREVAAGTILGLGLVLCTLLGLITPYLVVVIGLVLLVAFAISTHRKLLWNDVLSRLLLLAFVGLVAVYAITAEKPANVLSAANFIMLVLCAPISLALARSRERLNPPLPALLAAAGVAVTVLMAIWFQLQFGGTQNRMRAFNIGPIVAANAAFALAVIASTGPLILRSRWSLLLPLTLVGAIAVALMGGARGPLICVVPLALYTAATLWVLRRDSRWLLITGTIGAVAVAMVSLLAFGTRRVAKIPQIISNLLSGEASGDHTTEVRLAMYRAAWRSFLDSPLVGHGWARLMSAPEQYLDPNYIETVRGLNQLHNDVLDFLVAGGLVGLCIYVLIIAAPIIAAWRSPHDALRPARLFATGGLAIVYVCGGLTDLMFGHEFHTAFYVTLNAIVLALLVEDRGTLKSA